MENITLGLELAAKLLEVVDFAVEGNNNGLIVIAHRLFSSLAQVEDGKTAETERHAIIDELIAHIRPAMDNAVHHCRKNLLLVFDIAGEADKTAHRVPFVVKRAQACSGGFTRPAASRLPRIVGMPCKQSDRLPFETMIVPLARLPVKNCAVSLREEPRQNVLTRLFEQNGPSETIPEQSSSLFARLLWLNEFAARKTTRTSRFVYL